MNISVATIEDLEKLVPLFDGYRTFYNQESNLDAARNFLKERFLKQDSVIFLCLDAADEGLGFTQLYPSYSSVYMQRVFILNDLYVTPQARKKGVGEALMEAAKLFVIKHGGKGLTLETDVDNPAQKLYEKLGWKKDVHVNHYTWEA